MDGDAFDVLVLGAGLRGLVAALRVQREQPGARLLVVDVLPQPGGSIRTQRSNGFLCELGPFGFARHEISPVLECLHQPPPLVAALASAHKGSLFTGKELQPIPVDPMPVSFRTGNEELVQACRRELGPTLRLGRAATAIEPAPHGFVVTLGGEVPTPVVARRLVLALPDPVAGSLLLRFDPALADTAGRVRTEPHAFAFFGGTASEAPELRGYGVVPADDLDTPLAEAIFCAQVFPDRALPGRFLVRCEANGALVGGNDTDVLAVVAAELQRWTGLRAHLGFTKLHRFSVEVADGSLVECRVRLRGLATRVPGLTIF